MCQLQNLTVHDDPEPFRAKLKIFTISSIHSKKNNILIIWSKYNCRRIRSQISTRVDDGDIGRETI